MTELKPCPFCGGKAEPHAEPRMAPDGCSGEWLFYVECAECEATAGVCVATAGVTKAMEQSWSAWNRMAET